MSGKNFYTGGSIIRTLLTSSVAMLPGTVAITGYNLTDAYFVSRLGTLPLAAMGYTFPVIVLVNCLYRGIGVGMSAGCAHALGGRKHSKAAKIVSSGMVLLAIFAAVLAIAGMSTIEWTFTKYHAAPEAMPFIRDYMSIWYIGSFTIAMCMAGNDILITAGDTRWAGAVMFGGMLLNIPLNWLFINKMGMGMRGAAIATIIAQFLAACVVLIRLGWHHRLLTGCIRRIKRLLHVWRAILRISLPSIAGMLMFPLGIGVTTYVTNLFGAVAVAGASAAMRIETAAFIFPMSFGMTLMPMVGQNFGARLYDRIDECRRIANRIVFYFGLAMAVLLLFIAPWLTGFFTDDPEVAAVMTLYLRIVPWGFGLIEIHRYSTFFFTGCNRPNAAAVLNFFRIGVLLVPLSLLAGWMGSLALLFGARLVSDMVAGAVGWIFMTRLTKGLSTRKSSGKVVNRVA